MTTRWIIATSVALSLTVLAMVALVTVDGSGATVIQQALHTNPVAMTTIEKNQGWPIKGNITMQPCIKRFCQEV